jgi:hypothetical protein
LKRKTPRTVSPSLVAAVLPSLLAAVFALGAARVSAAPTPQSSGSFKPVRLKLPKGYMPTPLPEKRAGQLLLDAKRPAGMYILHPKAEESPETLNDSLKSMVAGMFLHETKSPVAWTASPLPSHEGVDNESGTLFSASDDRMEIQLAAYTRTVGGTKVAYGYYAMRHRDGKSKDDGTLLDNSGKGVEKFDKFCRSIRELK